MSKKLIKNKELKRQCSVCGADLIIVLLPNSHYSGGHYFGQLDLPGAKKAEYWECDNCYHDSKAEK